MPKTYTAQRLYAILFSIVDSYGRVAAPRRDQLPFTFPPQETDKMILPFSRHFCAPGHLFFCSTSLNHEVPA